MKLKIEPDFEGLIGPMTPEAFEQLKSNLKANPDGFPAIYVWGNHKGGDVIIDGHHQYKARTSLGLPVKPKKLNFDSRDEALAFAVKCQLGRRNLTTNALVRLAHTLRTSAQCSGADAAAAVGLSRRTVEQYEEVDRKATDEIKEAVDAGEISVRDAAKVADRPKSQQKKALAKVQAGEAKTLTAAATEFDTATLEKQAASEKPKRNGSPVVSTKKRKAALAALAILVRALSAIGIYDEYIVVLSQIAERLKQV